MHRTDRPAGKIKLKLEEESEGLDKIIAAAKLKQDENSRTGN